MTVSSDALAAIKAHCAIDNDNDDDLLSRQLEAAQLAVTADTAADTAVSFDTAPADLQQAMLMLVSHWYENRDSVVVGATAQNVPFGYWDLLKSHRKWCF